MHQLVLIVHVLGATIWTGGHLVLALTVLPRALRDRDPRIIHEFESGFERIGIPALIAQVITGLWLASEYLPSHAELLAARSHAAASILTKLVLLLVTLGLAVHARVRIIPRLTPERLSTLAYHIGAVTIVSVLFVILGVGIRGGGGF